jgi:hypothetical protein
MVVGKRLWVAVAFGFVVALLGACSPKEGALPTRLSVRAAAAPLQKTTVSEATLLGRLGSPTLVVPFKSQATWYYAVVEGGAVKLALTKSGEGSWRVDDLDSITGPEWRDLQAQHAKK